MGDTSSACPRCGDASGLCSHDDVFVKTTGTTGTTGGFVMPVRNFEIDHWVCRDEAGVLHAIQVQRFTGSDGLIMAIHVSAACLPQVVKREYTGAEPIWHGSHLPPVTLASHVTIVEYRVREAVTCLRCHALAVPRA